jgi:hypothetical protein
LPWWWKVCSANDALPPACRVLDALYRHIEKPGIFVQADFEHFLALFEDAIHQFEAAHEDTYMGRNDAMRRFFNRQKCVQAPAWFESRSLCHWACVCLCAGPYVTMDVHAWSVVASLTHKPLLLRALPGHKP